VLAHLPHSDCFVLCLFLISLRTWSLAHVLPHILGGELMHGHHICTFAGIPGEVVQGAPDFPLLANWETAHQLHETMAKRSPPHRKLSLGFPGRGFPSLGFSLVSLQPTNSTKL